MVELLVVIAIIVILAALLFPVFARAKSSAKKTQCISNLKQIGQAILMYNTEHEEVFPHAVDPVDKARPQIWDSEPEFQARIPSMPTIMDALDRYIKSREMWKCPGDDGSDVLDSHPFIEFKSAPSMFRTYGSSYFFRTEIGFRSLTQMNFELPAQINVLFDASGHWHGDIGRLRTGDDFGTWQFKLNKFRYNTLYGDMHVKNVSYGQLQSAWALDLGSSGSLEGLLAP